MVNWQFSGFKIAVNIVMLGCTQLVSIIRRNLLTRFYSFGQHCEMTSHFTGVLKPLGRGLFSVSLHMLRLVPSSLIAIIMDN